MPVQRAVDADGPSVEGTDFMTGSTPPASPPSLLVEPPVLLPSLEPLSSKDSRSHSEPEAYQELPEGAVTAELWTLEAPETAAVEISSQSPVAGQLASPLAVESKLMPQLARLEPDASPAPAPSLSQEADEGEEDDEDDDEVTRPTSAVASPTRPYLAADIWAERHQRPSADEAGAPADSPGAEIPNPGTPTATQTCLGHTHTSDQLCMGTWHLHLNCGQAALQLLARKYPDVFRFSPTTRLPHIESPAAGQAVGVTAPALPAPAMLTDDKTDAPGSTADLGQVEAGLERVEGRQGRAGTDGVTSEAGEGRGDKAKRAVSGAAPPEAFEIEIVPDEFVVATAGGEGEDGAKEADGPGPSCTYRDMSPPTRQPKTQNVTRPEERVSGSQGQRKSEEMRGGGEEPEVHAVRGRKKHRGVDVDEGGGEEGKRKQAAKSAGEGGGRSDDDESEESSDDDDDGSGELGVCCCSFVCLKVEGELG